MEIETTKFSSERKLSNFKGKLQQPIFEILLTIRAGFNVNKSFRYFIKPFLNSKDVLVTDFVFTKTNQKLYLIEASFFINSWFSGNITVIPAIKKIHLFYYKGYKTNFKSKITKRYQFEIAATKVFDVKILRKVINMKKELCLIIPHCYCKLIIKVKITSVIYTCKTKFKRVIGTIIHLY